MSTVADDALNAQAVNRMLGAGADVAQAFQQQVLSMAADNQRMVVSGARIFETTTQLITYMGAQALTGSAGAVAQEILSQRAVGGQPQSGGGPGQPVNFPVQQQLPQAPAVYSVNPTTGAITKA